MTTYTAYHGSPVRISDLRPSLEKPLFLTTHRETAQEYAFGQGDQSAMEGEEVELGDFGHMYKVTFRADHPWEVQGSVEKAATSLAFREELVAQGYDSATTDKWTGGRLTSWGSWWMIWDPTQIVKVQYTPTLNFYYDMPQAWEWWGQREQAKKMRKLRKRARNPTTDTGLMGRLKF